MQAALGIIEGFYGTPWPWPAREETIAFLAPHGYRFYLYAPKADAYLRERWQEDHPRETADRLRALADVCRASGVRFGIGLSPYEIYRDFGRDARAALARKLGFFAELGVDDLAILFDDMKGDDPDLAVKQVDIVHWIAERASAQNLVVCPTYYSDDKLLDRVFGERPENYLEELGTRLDPSIDVFWTGEEICARAFGVGHLERIAALIGRKPFLWDNYPVNDGKRMSQYLHLRAFTGRPAGIAGTIAAHGINPACQPVLSRIPPRSAWPRAMRKARRMNTAAPSRRRRRRWRARCWRGGCSRTSCCSRTPGSTGWAMRPSGFASATASSTIPAAREIVAWLDGVYRFQADVAS